MEWVILALIFLVVWYYDSQEAIAKPPPRRKTTPPVPYTSEWKRPVKSAEFINYTDYIKSDTWKKSPQRLACIAAAKNKCQMCGATFGLEVHHISYANLGSELPQQLVLLCILCHEHTHAMAGKGAKYYPPLRRPNFNGQ